MNEPRAEGGGGYQNLRPHKRFDLPATAYLRHIFIHLSYTKNSSTKLKGTGKYHELRIKSYVLQNLLRTCVDPVLHLFSSGTPTTLMSLAQL
jgi:hypothetical protein